MAYSLIGLGVLIQIAVFFITGGNPLSLLCGVSGVLAVVLCSERKMSYYGWSLIQMVTFTIICLQAGLYGKLVETTFNLITMGIGVYLWSKNMGDGNRVDTKTLNTDNKVVATIATMNGWCILYLILIFVGDSMPFFDATATSLAFLAQVLTILRFKENWTVWIVTDVICIIMWTIRGDWCIVTQYLFWIINALYGHRMWTKNTTIE